MGRYIKRYYQIRTIYLYKRTFYTLKDTIIVFIGIEKIQLLKYGCQLRVSEIPVCRTHPQLNNRYPHSSSTEQEIQKRTSCFFLLSKSERRAYAGDHTDSHPLGVQFTESAVVGEQAVNLIFYIGDLGVDSPA